MPNKSKLKIGEAAEAAGVSVQTLRYYEERGLLGSPRRTHGGFRLYDPEAIRRVRLIKRAQALGFTLEETAELLKRYGTRSRRNVKPLLDRKLTDVDAKLEELRRQRKSLLKLWGRCAAMKSDTAFLDALAQEIN